MFCSKCGTQVADTAAFCPSCGQTTGSVPAAPRGIPLAPGGGFVPPSPETVSQPPIAPPIPAPAYPGYAAAAPAVAYAGFWLRFVAYLIDTVILCIVYIVLFIVVIFASGVAAMLRNLPEHPTPDIFLRGAFIVAILVLIAIATAITWLYYAWMESSPSQGTLGKMAMGLIVTDMQYRPVSFARASGRFFARFITRLVPLWIGYIMAGFTAKKQALHDMIASCLVLRKI